MYDLMTSQGQFLTFLDHVGEHDPLFEPYLDLDAFGVRKRGFKRPKAESGICPICGGEKPKPKNSAKEAWFCASCFVDYKRILSRRQLAGYTHPTDERCMACGRPSGRGLRLTTVSQFKDAYASGVLKTFGALRNPESPIICAGCMSIFLTVIGRPAKVQPIAFAAGEGVFLTRKIPPWWRIPWRPALVYRTIAEGGQVHRAIYAEVSVDPDTIVLNVSQYKEKPRPETYVLPMVQDIEAFEGQIHAITDEVTDELATVRLTKPSYERRFNAILKDRLAAMARDQLGLDRVAADVAAREMRRVALNESEGDNKGTEDEE